MPCSRLPGQHQMLSSFAACLPSPFPFLSSQPPPSPYCFDSLLFVLPSLHLLFSFAFLLSRHVVFPSILVLLCPFFLPLFPKPPSTLPLPSQWFLSLWHLRLFGLVSLFLLPPLLPFSPVLTLQALHHVQLRFSFQPRFLL